MMSSWALSSGRLAGQHVAQLRHVVARDCTGLDRVREVAVVRRLHPVVAEHAHAREFLDRDLGLARTVGAHEAHVLAGLERPCGEDRLARRRDRDDDGRRERLFARRNARAELVRDRART